VLFLVFNEGYLATGAWDAALIAELDGPGVALAAVDRLEDKLAGYRLYHATRADLLLRLGRSQESRAAYGTALRPAGVAPQIPFRTCCLDPAAGNE
jgi:RNA polymerase sigma-70 factor, ECF subfamily